MKELKTPKEGKHAASGGNKGIAIAAAVCFLLVLSAIYFSIKGFNEDVEANKAQISSGALSSQSESAVTVDEQSPSKAESSRSSSSASQSSQQSSSPDQAEVSAPAADIEEQAYITPLSGEVIQSYSNDQLVFSATLGDWRVHSGLDFACPVGTPVEAIADGTVESVYYDELNGNTVTINHSGGCISVYCGLSDTFFVEAGQTVKQGDAIGSVGESMPVEMALGPHLHLEIIKDGKRIDPLSLIG